MPFARRSNEIWRELEARSGNTLLHQSGGLIIGSENAAAFHYQGDFVAASARIAEKFDIEHEVLSADETMRRFPLFKLSQNDRAYYEPGSRCACGPNAAYRRSSNWRVKLERPSIPTRRLSAMRRTRRA